MDSDQKILTTGVPPSTPGEDQSHRVLRAQMLNQPIEERSSFFLPSNLELRSGVEALPSTESSGIIQNRTREFLTQVSNVEYHINQTLNAIEFHEGEIMKLEVNLAQLKRIERAMR